MEPLSNDMINFLLKEHGEDAEQFAKDLEAIKEWLRKQPYMPNEIGNCKGYLFIHSLG